MFQGELREANISAPPFTVSLYVLNEDGTYRYVDEGNGTTDYAWYNNGSWYAAPYNKAVDTANKRYYVGDSTYNGTASNDGWYKNS